MNEVFLYLLESSLILAILYLVYYLLLRKEASFNFNRFYLIVSVIISLILPLLSMDVPSFGTSITDQAIRQLSDVRSNYQGVVEEWSYKIIDQDFSSISIATAGKEKNLSPIVSGITIVYAMGLVAMLLRFSWTLAWITKLRLRNPKVEIGGVAIVKVSNKMAPFSFLNSVFVSEEMLHSDELQHVLEHERTHIRQRHSYDLLIVQLLTAILWFNPVAWWLNKSLKTTHEYIADRSMIKQGYSLVEYQTLLLRQLISNNSFGLVHNFNLSFIKKRITMMNIQKIGHLGRFKVAIVITMTVLFSLIIVQCNSKMEEQDLSLKEEFSVNLPVIQDTKYTFQTGEAARLDITIKNDQVYANQTHLSLEGLKNLKGDFHPKTQVVFEIDKGQKMKLVNDVQKVLRDKDLRVVVYVGMGQSGEILNIPLMLPPAPDSKSGITVPKLTDEFVRKNGIQLLEVNLGAYQENYAGRIFNTLKDPAVDKSSLVVRGRFKGDDTYGVYLASLSSMKQAYYDYYDERALELFGKTFYDINREQKTSEEARQQYMEVRKGVPMSIVFEMI